MSHKTYLPLVLPKDTQQQSVGHYRARTLPSEMGDGRDGSMGGWIVGWVGCWVGAQASAWMHWYLHS